MSNQGTEGQAELTGEGVKRKDGCFYTVNTLMILLFAVPVLILLVVGSPESSRLDFSGAAVNTRNSGVSLRKCTPFPFFQ